MRLLPASAERFLQSLVGLALGCFKAGAKAKAPKAMLKGGSEPPGALDRMHSLAYGAEEEAFAPRAIKSPFESAGIFSLNSSKITELARRSLGLQKKQEKLKHASSMAAAGRRAFDALCGQKAPSRGKLLPPKNMLLAAQRLAERGDQRAAKKERAARRGNLRREKQGKKELAKEFAAAAARADAKSSQGKLARQRGG